MLRYQSPSPSASQKSRYMKLLQFPQRGILWRVPPVARVAFYMSLVFLNKNSANKNRNFTHLSKALGKKRPPMFPKTGPLWKQTPISRALRSISVGVPSK